MDLWEGTERGVEGEKKENKSEGLITMRSYDSVYKGGGETVA